MYIYIYVYYIVRYSRTCFCFFYRHSEAMGHGPKSHRRQPGEPELRNLAALFAALGGEFGLVIARDMSYCGGGQLRGLGCSKPPRDSRSDPTLFDLMLRVRKAACERRYVSWKTLFCKKICQLDKLGGIWNRYITCLEASIIFFCGGSFKVCNHRCPLWLTWFKNRGPWFTWWFHQLPGKPIDFPKKDMTATLPWALLLKIPRQGALFFLSPDTSPQSHSRW